MKEALLIPEGTPNAKRRAIKVSKVGRGLTYY